MKRAWIALALALAMTGSLAACSRDAGEASGSGAEQASRRTSSIRRQSEQFVQDGRYAAGEDGRLRADSDDRTRSLEKDLRDMIRDTGDAAKDAGERMGDAARDVGDNVKNAVRDAAGQ